MANQIKKLTLEVSAPVVKTSCPQCKKLLTAGAVYGRLRRFRGKVKLSVKLSKLRKD